MSKVDDLIRELAPKGVQFETLGEVGEFIRGNGLRKSDLTTEGAPAIHYGEIHTYYGTWTETTKSFTDPALAARLRCAKTGDLIIATTSEDDDAVAKATAWLGENVVAVSGDAYIFRHTLDPRYVSYFLQSKHFQIQKARHVTGTKVRRISGDALAKIRIPVPPVEVQEEIVRVLDLINSLEVELSAEMEARRHQYAYYRDTLMSSCSDGVPRAPLANLLAYEQPTRYLVESTNYDDAYAVPVLTAGQTFILGHTKETSGIYEASPTRPVIIFDDFTTAFKWVDFAFKAKSSAMKMLTPRLGVPVRLRFAYYAMQLITYRPQDHARQWISRYSGFEIAVPPLEVQDEVVRVFDLFTALDHALHAELTARRSQFDYYRDRLLTFEAAT